MSEALRFGRHTAALAGRSLTRTRRLPEQLLDVTLQPVIFVLVFTYVLGGAIGGGDRQEYLQYLLPGILAQAIAQSAIMIGVNLNTDLDQGVFDRFRSMPIARAVPLVGAVLADVVRYGLLTAIMLGFGVLLGFSIETGVLEAVAAVALAIGFALCFCWISVWIGMTARSPGAVQGIVFLLVLPLTFASSVFADPATMPSWLQTFTDVNPLSQLVDAMRGLLVGGPVWSPVWHTLVAMAMLLAVFVPLALRAYGRRV